MHESEINCFVNIFFTLHGECIVEIEAAYKDEIQAQHFHSDSKGKLCFVLVK